mmetsp:Transcript_506/g.1556  ORF Transcript_506/g.1556 Transcript_506/m.1556 type:complete len:200 (+) Transcript_506:15-614(+)
MPAFPRSPAAEGAGEGRAAAGARSQGTPPPHTAGKPRRGQRQRLGVRALGVRTLGVRDLWPAPRSSRPRPWFASREALPPRSAKCLSACASCGLYGRAVILASSPSSTRWRPENLSAPGFSNFARGCQSPADASDIRSPTLLLAPASISLVKNLGLKCVLAAFSGTLGSWGLNSGPEDCVLQRASRAASRNARAGGGFT